MLLWVLLATCYQEGPTVLQPSSVERSVDFAADVQPILRRNCLACHNRNDAEGDLNLESYESIMNGASGNPVVVPGDAGKSLLLQVAKQAVEPTMPPIPNDVNAKLLTAEQLGILRKWILDGAKPGGATSRDIQWQALSQSQKSIFALDVAADGRQVAVGRGNRLFIYNLSAPANAPIIATDATLDLTFGAASHRDVIQSVAFHPNGNMIATGGYAVVKLWKRDLPTRDIKLADDQAVQIVGLNRLLVVGSQGVAEISAEAQTALVGTGPIERGLTSASSDFVATAVGQTVSLLRRAQTGEPTSYNLPVPIKSIHLLPGSQGTVLALTEDNQLHLAAAADDFKALPAGSNATQVIPISAAEFATLHDETLRVWKGGEVARELNIGPSVGCCVTPDAAVAIVMSKEGVSLRSTDGKKVVPLNRVIEHESRVADHQHTRAIADRRFAWRNRQHVAAKKEVESQQATHKTVSDAKQKADAALATALTAVEAAEQKLTEAKKNQQAKPKDAAAQKAVEAAEKALEKSRADHTKATATAAAAAREVKVVTDVLERVGKRLELRTQQLEHVKSQQTLAVSQLAELQKLMVVPANPVQVAWSETLRAIVTVHADDSVRYWDTAGNPLDVIGLPGAAKASELSHETLLIDSESSARLISIVPAWSLAGSLVDNISDRVMGLDFSQDGQLLALGTGVPSRSGELQVWDVASGAKVLHVPDAHSDTILDVEFSDDGAHLLTCGADKFAKIFRTKSGEHVRSFEGHTHYVLSASFQPDGDGVATAGADNVVKFWDAETGAQRRTIGGYRQQVTSVMFTGSADNILSCSGDRTVRFHTASNGRNTRTFGGAREYLYAVSATRDGSVVVAGGFDGVVHVWNGRDGKLIHSLSP